MQNSSPEFYPPRILGGLTFEREARGFRALTEAAEATEHQMQQAAGRARRRERLERDRQKREYI